MRKIVVLGALLLVSMALAAYMGGTTSPEQAEAFFPTATISDVSPRYGPTSGGTYSGGPNGEVTITGSGFLAVKGVKFGSGPLIDCTVSPNCNIVSDTKIVARPPAHGSGEGVEIKLSVPGGLFLSPPCILQLGCPNAFFYMEDIPFNLSHTGTLPTASAGGLTVQAGGSIGIDGTLRLARNAGIPSAFIFDASLAIDTFSATVTLSGGVSAGVTVPWGPLAVPGVVGLYARAEAGVVVSGTIQGSLSDIRVSANARFINGNFSGPAVKLFCSGNEISAANIAFLAPCVSFDAAGLSANVFGSVSPLWLQIGPDPLNAGFGPVVAAAAGTDTSIGEFAEVCGSLHWSAKAALPLPGDLGVKISRNGNVLGPFNLFASPDNPTTYGKCPLGGGDPGDLIADDGDDTNDPDPGDAPPNPDPIDATPPIIAVTVTPPANSTGWNNSPVTVDWTVRDPESGIASTVGCIDQTLVNETGGIVLECSAVNGDGLQSTTFTRLIRIDKTAPTTSVSLDPPTPNGKRGWYISDVTVTLTATDPILSNGDPPSGVDTTTYRVNGGTWNTYSGPFVVSTESLDNVVEFFSDDVADNVEAMKNVHFKLDKTPPEIELTGGELDGMDWPPERFIKGVLTNDPVLRIECTATDNLFLHEVRAEDVDSGQTLATQNLVDDPPLTSSPCSLDIPLHEGINTIDIIAEDCAGWEDSVRIQVVYVVPIEHDPRTIGFWANAVKTGKYTDSEVATLLSYINVASDVFGAGLDGSTMDYGVLTPDNYRQILRPKSRAQEDHQKAQLVADWLNMVSGRLTVIYGVAMDGVPSWPTVVDNTSGDPVTFALNVTYEVEEVIDSGVGTDGQFETGKNLLEGKNVGNLLDGDEDGLPDQYEAANPCLDANTADALADPDGDGKTNAEEFALATDPCVPD